MFVYCTQFYWKMKFQSTSFWWLFTLSNYFYRLKRVYWYSKIYFDEIPRRGIFVKQILYNAHVSTFRSSFYIHTGNSNCNRLASISWRDLLGVKSIKHRWIYMVEKTFLEYIFNDLQIPCLISQRSIWWNAFNFVFHLKKLSVKG